MKPISKTTYTETVDGYTLTLTNVSNFYAGARDAKGNSCIKLGASSKAGGFSFTVPADVTSVVICIGKYKTNTTKITVNGTTVSKKTLSFYASGSSGTLYHGDSVAVGFSTGNAQGMTSAEFEFEYDASKLEFESLELGTKMTSAQNSLYSVNTSVPGYIKVSYASTAAVTGSLYPMITVNFKVIAEKAGNTDVSLKLSGLYDVSLNPINGGTVTQTLNIAQKEEAPTLPQITVSGFDGTEESFDIVVKAPGASGLAAAVRLDALGVKDIAIYTEGLGMGTSINTGSDKQTYYKLGMYGKEGDSPVMMARDLSAGGSMHGDIA
jgi:hypothetical protein